MLVFLPLLAPASLHAAFAGRKIITINRAQVPGTANHIDFPVLVSITGDNNLKTTANGGLVTSAQGHDIVFRAEDATSCAPAASPCRLDHEIESYDPVAGTLVAWVRVPTLQYSGAAANTVIYLYYGDASVTCSQQNKTGVWNSGYREVFHLNASGDHTDSTVNAFTAVGKGAVTNGAAGLIGSAVDFGGGALGTTPARLVVSDGTLPATTSFTFEAWVYFRTYVPGGFVGFVTKGRECLNFDGSPVPQPGFCLAEPCGDWVALYKASVDKFSLGWAWGGGPGGCKVGNLDDPGAIVNTGQWYHVAGSFDVATKTRRLLVNGSEVVTDTGTACLANDIPHYTLMGIDNLQDDYLDGVLDEMRVSFVARSNDWITTGYNNQSSPATFYQSVVDEAGSFVVSTTACPAVNPCLGGPGTCYLRSIGNTTVYSTGSGACTATNGSSVVSCPGAGWQSANRGRGDRITIDLTDYMVRSVDSETQLQLATPFTGTTGVGNKSYTMSRQFATPQAWENCISTGGAACPYFPVASGNLVTGNRSEIGVIYTDASPYTAAGVEVLLISGSTTDAAHTITLTADGPNRHLGVSGAGVVLDNAANLNRALVIQDQYVAVEWLEVRNGSGAGAHCIDFLPANGANRGVIRNNIVRSCAGQSIRVTTGGVAPAPVADITNNILYRGGREGVNVDLPLVAGSLVRILNNTFLGNNSASATPWTEVGTSETPNPYVVLRNNIIVDDTQSPDATWNGLALCTNAANCDWWNAASGHNITGDASPPVGKWRSDIGPNPRGGGLYSATEASLSFVDTTAGSENLHLLTGSPAWNAAPALSGLVLGDIDAQARSGLWDIGADELPASSAPPLIAYSDTAASGVRPLLYTTFQSGAWSAPGQVALPVPVASGFPSASDWPLFAKVARTSPNGQRRGVVFAENDLGNRMQLHATFWDGTSWINGIGGANGTFQSFGDTAETSPVTSRYFDAAYEQQSGDFLVVTGTNADESVDIYLHSGSSWSGNLRFTPAGNGTMLNQGEVGAMTFRWVRLEPRPASNQVAFIGLAHDPTQTSGVVHAAIWDGDANTFGSKAILSLPVTNGQNANTADAVDIDFVLGGANAGEALAVWGNQTQLWRRIWNPGTGWGASASVQDLGAGNTLRSIRQKAASNGDDVILAIEDVNERIYTIRYDGNTRAFASFSAVPHSTTAYANADLNRPFDVVWDLGTGANTVLLVYSDTAGIKYKVSGDGGAFWTPEQTLTLAYQAHWIQLERDPSNVVHLVIKDQANALRAWSWRAGTWTVTTPVQVSSNVETNGANQNVESFAIATYPPVTVTTAVKLQSFEATGTDGAVELSWRTGSELDNQGFHVYRGASADGPWTRLTTSLIPGMGSSPLGKSYSWRDSGLVNGQRYYYRLEDVDTRSKSTFHGPVSAVPEAAAPPAPAPEPESGRKPRSDGATPRNACPTWVLTEYAASAPGQPSADPKCTRHGDPEAVSFAAVGRDSRSAVFELRTGGFYAVHEADGRVRAFVPGFDSPTDPKAPALPLRRVLVDAIVGRQARLAAVAALDRQSFAGLRPAAIGEADMEIGRDGTVRPRRREARGLRRSSGLLPRDVATLAGTVFQGEQKSAVVELQPLRYDARRGRLVLASRVRFRLDFSARDAEEAGLGNRGRRRPRRPPAATSEVLAELHASQVGIHAVAFEALFPSGGGSLPVAALVLKQQDVAVPFHVEPAGASFGRGSVLYFHVAAPASSTSFTGEVAFQLLGSAGGVAMARGSAAPQGASLGSASRTLASFETNRFYQPGLLDAPDLWLWEILPSGAVKVKPFTLAGVDGLSPLGAQLVVDLQGATDALETSEDHHVRVSVNGIEMGEAFFDGKRAHRASFSLPASLLREGPNELAVANVGDTGVSSLVFLDRFSLEYPQASRLQQGGFDGTWPESGTAEISNLTGPAVVLDVTDAGSGRVTWLDGFTTAGGVLRFQAQALRRYRVASGASLLAPRVVRPGGSTLRDPANQADYLLVAPRAFLAAATPLVERRQSQGLRGRAVSLEEIASAFGGGQPSAEAIREFLRFAFHSWSRPSPRYVLLLGDSTYDPRNFTGTALASPLPALWVGTSYLVTASDPALAAVNGEDALPDLAIGRLPARTPEEAEQLVAKLLAWEDSGQDLTGRALLVADNPDVAGDFEADIRDVAESFLVGREVQLAHVRELGAGTRPAILDALNSGLSLLGYVGHGGAAVWASENVLNSWDMPSLLAQSRQPLLVTMNCLNGYFVAPGYDALGEALVKADGRGAIAAFSPSGLSLDGPAHVLHRALMSELTRGSHERLGDAVLAAQKTYAETGAMPELVSIYHLFGDPALTIR
jgi:hypothetical protein